VNIEPLRDEWGYGGWPAALPGWDLAFKETAAITVRVS
jgi:hypothetical protein